MGSRYGTLIAGVSLTIRNVPVKENRWMIGQVR